MNATLTLVGPALADREHAVEQLVADAVSPLGLSPQHEATIRDLAHRVIVRVLEIEDSLAVKALEIEALYARMDAHAAGCTYCKRRGDCDGMKLHKRRLDRLEWAFASEARSLARRL